MTNFIKIGWLHEEKWFFFLSVTIVSTLVPPLSHIKKRSIWDTSCNFREFFFIPRERTWNFVWKTRVWREFIDSLVNSDFFSIGTPQSVTIVSTLSLQLQFLWHDCRDKGHLLGHWYIENCWKSLQQCYGKVAKKEEMNTFHIACLIQLCIFLKIFIYTN